MRKQSVFLFACIVISTLIPAWLLAQDKTQFDHKLKDGFEGLNGSTMKIAELDKAIDMHQKSGNTEGVASAFFDKGNYQVEIKQYDLAEKSYIKSLEIAETVGFDSLSRLSSSSLSILYTMTGETLKSLRMSEKSAAIAVRLNDYFGIISAYTNAASSFVRIGKQDSAIFYYQKAIKYNNEHGSDGTSRVIYFALARFYHVKGDYEGSLIYALKVLEIDEKSDVAVFLLPDDLTFLAQILIQLKDYNKAESYALRAYDICKKNNMKIYRVLAADCLAKINLNKKDTLSAIKVIQETIDAQQKAPNNMSLGDAYALLADIYIKHNDLEAALSALQKVKELNLKIADPDLNRNWQVLMGDYYLKRNQSVQAIASLTASLQNTQLRHQTHTLPKIYQSLSKAYAQNGQYALAMQYAERYNQLNDSLNDKSRVETLMAIESRYELTVKEQKITDLSSENDVKEERIKAAKQFQWLLTVGLGLTTLLGGVAFFQFKGKQKQAAELAIKNAEITKATHDKDLLLREIHHRVKNNLQIISSLLRLQSRHIVDSQAQEALKEGRNRVQSMALIHQLLYNDDEVTKIQADEYIKKLAETLYQSYDISDKRIALTTTVDPIKLDVDLAISLGLIVNELITNALKHAFPEGKSGHLNVSLLRGGNQSLILSVNDNGIGFNKEAPSEGKKKSFGWGLVELFTEKLEGQLTKTNEQGTHIQLKFNNL